MTNIKSTVAKSLFIIALCCPAAFADGDQGSGGFADDGGAAVTTCESRLEGDQGSGGFTSTPCEETGYVDSVVTTLYGFIESMI